MKKVTVNVNKPYDVIIGSNILSECGERIKSTVGGQRAAVITDSNVAPLYLRSVLDSLEAVGYETDSYTIPAGEQSKSITTLGQILEFLALMGYTKSDVVVALGGGVVGDITGFAAAVYLRGIDFVQLPTSLLAAVDSSVGGKTAIDLLAGKNLAGAFKQPRLVMMDTDTLLTLPNEEFSNGMAETIKYGVLFDEELFDECLNVEMNIEDIIAKCVEYKARIVEQDEFDKGSRKLLNLGHTVGHAIEKASAYSVPHGKAVAVGMVMITRAGERFGITEKGTADRIISLLKVNDLPTEYDFDTDRLAGFAQSDKKRDGGIISLIIPEKIGKCIIKDEPVSRLKDYTKAGSKND